MTRADEAHPVRRLLNQMYPLHSGYGLPVLYSAVVFLCGAGACWLGWTGVMSWLQRRRHRAR